VAFPRERRPVAVPTAKPIAPKAIARIANIAHAPARRDAAIESPKTGPAANVTTNNTAPRANVTATIASALPVISVRRRTGVDRIRSSVRRSSSPAIARDPAPIAKIRKRISARELNSSLRPRMVAGTRTFR
jgi:hypothetical protein